MKVKYIGKNLVAMERNKIYEVISIENGWYRIMTEIDEDYLFPPKLFEIVEADKFVKDGKVTPIFKIDNEERKTI